MSQMLDVIHYFFEEDSRYASAEEAESLSQTRTTLYAVLYGTTYKYPIKISKTDASSMSGSAGGTKPYMAPTQFDADSAMPFGNLLDSPLG